MGYFTLCAHYWISWKQGIKTVLIGNNDDDYWINNNICKQALDAKPINLSGKTTITDLPAVSANALFCVGNDTMPTHVAALVGTKTIMILSRMSPAEYIVPKVKNLAVIEEPYLQNLGPERVIEAITEFCDIKNIIAAINGKAINNNQKDTVYKSY